MTIEGLIVCVLGALFGLLTAGVGLACAYWFNVDPLVALAVVAFMLDGARRVTND